MSPEQTSGLYGSDVLVVEDHAETREMVALYLTGHKIPVRTASNAFEALDAVRTAPPALILLDLMMPQLSGESFGAFCRRTRDYRRSQSSSSVPAHTQTRSRSAWAL